MTTYKFEADPMYVFSVTPGHPLEEVAPQLEEWLLSLVPKSNPNVTLVVTRLRSEFLRLDWEVENDHGEVDDLYEYLRSGDVLVVKVDEEGRMLRGYPELYMSTDEFRSTHEDYWEVYDER